MSALGTPVLINQSRAYWLSSIANDVIHSTIQVNEVDANIARISTLDAGVVNASSFNVSSLGATTFDVSGMYVSSIRGNTAFFSSMSLASDLSGGLGYVRFSVDASGIQVDGDPIRFDNLVYLTSTINIVQVSTIVDTDIFAQNGYFSTLSTGSLSANTVSLNQANISSLYVSSLEGFDISGAEPKDWSLYPTLNSSITFQPGNVLSNAGNNLYYNGINLTDLSGGGINWSYFPALSTVQMSNNLMTGLSSIRFQDNGTLTSATGNNLLYNGQPVQYGSTSNVQNWANYPAVANVNGNNNSISNVALFSGSNLNLTGSNITNGNTFTGTLGVAGTSLIPLASINNLGQLSCQDIDVSNPAIGLADVNIYGALALPGDNALYVQGGTTLDGGAIHGFTAGCLPVAGINTARIDVLQAGVNLLTPTVMAITAGGAIGITAGGALSLAGGGYVEMNTSTLQMINTSQGNKNTTVQAGFLTIDPDIAATSSIKLFNTSGGGVEIDGGGQGSLIGFSTLIGGNVSTINLNVSTINGVPLSSIQTPDNIVCSNINVAQSTISQNFWNSGFASLGFGLWNNALGISTTIGALRVNNIQIPDNITGITNAPMPLESRIENFSSIQSGTISTINLVCSTINGAPPGSGGGGNVFSTLGVSTMSGVGGSLFGSTINVDTGLQFVGQGVNPGSGHFISSLKYLNSIGENLFVEASTTTISYYSGLNSNGSIRLGGGGAFDTYIKDVGSVAAVSTMKLMTSTIQTPGTLDVSGGIYPTAPVFIALSNAVQFDDGSFANYSQFEWRDIANNGMLALTNTPAATSNNMEQLAVGELWITGGSDQYGAVRFYSEFAYGNLGIDVVDAGGTTLLEAYNLYDVGGNNYQANLTVVSSITGYTPNAGESATGFDNLITVPKISTLALQVSSIVGNDARPAYTNNLQLSTMNLYQNSTTLLCWSTSTTHSNINTTDYDTVVGVNGTYKFGVSLQMNNSSGSDQVQYFFIKNGTAIQDSASIHTIPNNEQTITYAEIIEPMSNGDNIQVGCYTTSADLVISTMGGFLTNSPGAIFTAYKVD